MEQSMNQAVMNTNVRTEAAARRGLKWLAAGVVLAISATVALSAWAQPGPGGRHHGEGMGGPGMMFMGGHGRGLDRMLDSVNASDAQRAKIKQIAQQAATDLKAQREQNRGLRERMLQIYTAPTDDATAADGVRRQMLAQHEAASLRMQQAMLDIANTLTPEQRAKIAELVAQRRQHMMERMQQHRQNAQPKQ
jgi:Spy/CpxP family protein refolding chaperone